MAKTFKQMNKEELVKTTESLKLTDAVVAIAKDPENPTNAEYVTVLEEFKSKQDEVNANTKEGLKDVKYKYIVTDHQSNVVIEDDDETRTFPIQYGNMLKGPKNWNVGLHGNPQALPFSVAKKLEEVPMNVHIKNGKGEPTVKTQSRFRVTKIEGWSQDEIDALKRSQNTRKFKD